MEMDDHKRRRNMILYVLIACVIYLVLNTLLFPNIAQRQQVVDVSYTQLLDDLENEEVNEIKYDNSSLDVSYSKKGEDNTVYTTTAMSGAQQSLEAAIRESGAKQTNSVQQDNSLWTYMLLMYGLPLIIFFALGVWLNRRMKKAAGDDSPSMNFGGGGFGGMGGGLGKSGARIVASKDVGVTFKDVAGQEEAKESLKEVVDFLENPKRYEDIGARLPRGALLVGPPGTGKTLLAKAVAGEAGVPFFSISGSEFVEMFVGRGAAKVRDLFKQANEKAPCIVFIDEIDAVGKRRDQGLSSNDEREQTLNQLLTEMDGFDNHKGIVVLAATNRPDSLDPALLRPGRFDRRIPVELPDLTGRKAILELHAKDVKVEPPIDLTAIARATPGASGADLSNIINEGALRAVRMGRKRATQEDFEESVEVVIAGQKRKSTVLSDHEKQVVSYHEIGHAIVAANMKGGAPVTKITIVPRTSGALGYTMQVEEDEKFLTTKQEVLDKLAVYCGGRAAEELIFGEMTTGAANDIEQATKLARNMITRFGMSDEFGMMALGTVQNAYLNQDASLTCAPGTAERVDEAVKKVIEDAHARAIQVLKENKFKLHELARYLYKKETITGEEFMTLLKRENPLMPPKPQA
ncbi:ATP-dependent zinc metalloprotease FtsH [Enorma phocaeensis]|uniref:ATP-dependent zinc metalloprotease FtsH n=1 Tax=Enorma phocaeensis TaxID=1871019 RepID=A0ABT7V6B8_9ACTN|nr:ATP-dependent zinc metalloprotease FtsH [Enorma phocaeensis]MDM8274046.1 ATP-dependent zinc metalloprotease FtsH [Enorma phocaeensis]